GGPGPRRRLPRRPQGAGPAARPPRGGLMAGPTVVVAGALANKPGNGGEAWVRLSWIRGLERLGCRVVFVEEIDEAVCTDAQRRPAPFATSANRAWFGEVTGRFG